MIPILLALALTLAPAPYDDGAEGCIGFGVYTEVVANGGELTFVVPDGDVTAVVLGDESDPVQHTIIAPVTAGQVVTSDVYIDHVHVCYAQAQPTETTWPDTTSTTTTTLAFPPSTLVPPSTNDSASTSAPTTSAVSTTSAPESTSTSSPTPSSTPTTTMSAGMPSGASRTLPATGVGTMLAWWAAALSAGGLVLLWTVHRTNRNQS